ncbi:hypothetical protein [Aminobacter sp. MDW-2]|uniref:hypothetical protein n=1 Tax=Aminobacter sp. MDW-2 TaxID=2666139 RepID=UPI0012AFEF1F|nr:hypothetical protein [Aminobacter sp. MDW-2]MRX32831.1 hypothetical protein [Aminobacter sp. MDW-2]QNH34512.1 hypothetical protein H5P29_00720 [Aminobacter sp. MDW-2]
MTFPTAEQIATAIVLAARQFGDDPMAVARGEPFHRSRHMAVVALMEVFPDAPKRGLARCCGYGAPKGLASSLKYARSQPWWSDDLIDEVVGALVADQYGEQSE